MMMTDRSAVSSSRFLALAGFAIFIIVAFFAAGFQSPIRAFFADILASRGYAPYASLSRVELEKRLLEAEEELVRTRYQAALYGLLTEENTNLRNAASVQSITTAVPARVLSRPPRTHYDTLVIGAGSATGVSVHDTVVWNGVLLGEVISTTASSATVELFSTPKSEHDVILGNPSAVTIARGLGGGAFEVLVPQAVAVAPGDFMRAATDETLLFGVVVSVSGSANDATKTVHAASPVSMNDLDFVTIIPQGDI